MKLILGSGSPRRRRILRTIGMDFSVQIPEVEEWLDPALPAVEAIRRVAAAKAEAIVPRSSHGLVVAADTAIVLDDRILGKPVDSADAVEILKSLRGRDHSVVTALAVMDCRLKEMKQSHVTTVVRLHEISDQDIRAYVDTGEPMDKAGAYAIQGAGSRLVASVEGCHLNVVGLPLCELLVLLAGFGVAVSAKCTLPSGEMCPRVQMRGVS